MRINVLRNLGSGWPALKEGELANVENAIGQKLIAAGLATEVNSPFAKLKTDAPAPEFNTTPVKTESAIEGTEALSGTDASIADASPVPSERKSRRRQESAEATT